jgi:hypothetical protein
LTHRLRAAERYKNHSQPCLNAWILCLEAHNAGRERPLGSNAAWKRSASS